MSTQDFDNLTAALADRAISRRRALQMAAASALGIAGLGIAAGKAHAAPQCPAEGAGCCRRCRNTNKVCVCLRRVFRTGRTCVHRCCYDDTQFTDEELFCGGDFGGCGDLPGDNVCVRSECCGPLPGNARGTCMRVCAGQGRGEDCEPYSC